MKCTRNHQEMTTGFCPDCGKRNATTREPGEFARMKDVLKKMMDEAPKGDKIGGLFFVIAATSTIDWAAGEMGDEQYTSLMRTAVVGKE